MTSRPEPFLTLTVYPRSGMAEMGHHGLDTDEMAEVLRAVADSLDAGHFGVLREAQE